jgi:indolepyruvate ferredoxin oxidoreductase, beta subunit
MNAVLPADPYNVIIAGVGGQGNVMASRLLGNMLALDGIQVTIGETFGVSQRGGSVMSHLRLSATSTWSPQIPRGQAHVVIALEPIEGLRVLAAYGNPDVRIICNTRPLHPVGVISGEMAYPSLEAIQGWMDELTTDVWFLDATEEAVKLGNPVFANIVLLGMAAGTGLLPLERDGLEAVLSVSLTADKVASNLAAFDVGRERAASPL